MRTRTITAALLLTALATASCSSADPKPAATVTVTADASASPALSKAEITEQCIDAVAQRAADTTGAEVPSEPTPAPCAGLSDSDYLDAYMDGISAANNAAREELDRLSESEAAKDAQ